MALLDQTLEADVVVELSSAVDDGGGRSPYNPPSILEKQYKASILVFVRTSPGIRSAGLFIYDFDDDEDD